MDDEPSLLWEANNFQPNVETNFKSEDDAIHEDVEDLFNELHGISVEELEVELRRKEKELYLCSRLGLFLAQEVDELVSQRRGIVSDHTRLLLELQEYRDSRRSFLDISDGASEHACSSVNGKNGWNRSSGTSNSLEGRESLEQGSGQNNVCSLHSQVFKFDDTFAGARRRSTYNLNKRDPRVRSGAQSVKARESSTKSQSSLSHSDRTLLHEGPTLGRAGSDQSLDLISNAESTMTSSSSSVRELHHDLETVQRSHDRITKIEVVLDKTRAKYRSLMTKYAHRLKEMSRELGSCVNRARPYFEAVKKAKKCHLATQQAAIEYKRAVNLQKAARDMVKVAEDRVMQAEDKLDPTWQEMLNQANIKVNEAYQEKNRVHKVHLRAAKYFQDADEKKTDLQQKLQRSIVKSKPYFQVQKEFQDKLETTTKKLNILELKLMEARQAYSANLARLRKSDVGGKSSGALQSLSERGMGVGAENPLGLPDSVSALPKPAVDFLEREVSASPDGASKANSDDLASDLAPQARTKLRYNPYDLLYLTDLGSDSTSNIDSDDEDDEYLQDF